MATFIQPYPDSQTQAKLLILQRKKPAEAATLQSLINGSGADASVDPKARATLINIFSQEALGNGG